MEQQLERFTVAGQMKQTSNQHQVLVFRFDFESSTGTTKLLGLVSVSVILHHHLKRAQLDSKTVKLSKV